MSKASDNLTNNGFFIFAGSLHTFTVSTDYNQGSTGTLTIRLANGNASDVLSVNGTATLDGTLTLTAQGSLDPNQMWKIMATNGIAGDFATFNWPDLIAGWGRFPGNPNDYEVEN